MCPSLLSGIPLLTKVEMGAGRGTLQLLDWAASIALYVSQQEQKQLAGGSSSRRNPLVHRPHTSMGHRDSWVGSQTSLALSSAVALGPGEAVVLKDATAPWTSLSNRS